ncbi:MAG TPA: CbiX/SirB N-terminal domain-containing protein [Accumulibacter sp.]|nr:CbiX/SirB N-terminal domain-containing protein [Accumulibacter sp.]
MSELTDDVADCTTTSTALVLFAHGARDPEWAEPIRRLRTQIQQHSALLPVELAFFEYMSPTLDACVGELIRAGCGRIVVLPVFIASGGHLKRDVPALLARLRQSYPGTAIDLAAPVGESAVVLAAMAQHALTLLTP